MWRIPYAQYPEGTADSGKHALSVIEGDDSSQEQKERGFGGEGQKAVRGVADLKVCGVLF